MRPLTLALTATLVLTALSAAPAAPRPNKLPDDAQAVLAGADRLVLLSLDPVPPKERPQDHFRGWKVLGRTEVKDKATRERIVAALTKGIAENKGNLARCFNPRHGISATQGGTTVDLVICFECLQIRVAVNGKDGPLVLVTESPEPVFDKVLKDAGVPLAPKPKDR
jgi:hypothetical protein